MAAMGDDQFYNCHNDMIADSPCLAINVCHHLVEHTPPSCLNASYHIVIASVNVQKHVGSKTHLFVFI